MVSWVEFFYGLNELREPTWQGAFAFSTACINGSLVKGRAGVGNGRVSIKYRMNARL